MLAPDGESGEIEREMEGSELNQKRKTRRDDASLIIATIASAGKTAAFFAQFSEETGACAGTVA
ncbi:MAG TPA: hypothetical protein PLN52_23450, partial [Opitutaceae bacterium]|nr:hypothetical protein [Opitutaceae bacterium]